MSLISTIARRIEGSIKKPSTSDTPPKEIKIASVKAPDPINPCFDLKFLNNLINSLKDGVIIVDADNNIVLSNPSIGELTGKTSTEISRQSLGTILVLEDQNGKPITVEDPNRIPSEKINLVSKDKNKIQVVVSITPIPQDQKNNLGYALIIRDVTQEQVFEQMQIDFVSMASHEFRTPITSIINYLAVIQEESNDKLNTEQKDFLDRALTSAKQLSTLVDNILNVAKVERGSIGISPQPLDWQKNLTDIVKDNKVTALKKNLTLELKLSTKELPKVLADQIRINEVLNNLISNALNYTKESGKIEVGAKTEGNEVITYISDTGIGIPKEAISHLFTKFYRAPDALKEGNKGSGLGLYISKSIIDMHHGKIWAESTMGKGSTFYFSLPVADSAHSTPTMAKLVSSK